MRKYQDGKNILKKDAVGLSFVKKKLKQEIDRDIEECLKKQQKEIDQIVDDLYHIVKSKFKSIPDFQIFVLKNIELKSVS
ncbi:hypothetical protein [Aquimarina algiphila]|uniref:Uncharacterized protein n=1 Tax=Aquimarina algiphila TaxID=2047982 RepID=A0A554VCA7_9FLAO|nr:hypothetical protein [Aquimarina algiphila]TSE04268.1 hypothetical protein FOF46_26800 [Aquimarina algiphila]